MNWREQTRRMQDGELGSVGGRPEARSEADETHLELEQGFYKSRKGQIWLLEPDRSDLLTF